MQFFYISKIGSRRRLRLGLRLHDFVSDSVWLDEENPPASADHCSVNCAPARSNIPHRRVFDRISLCATAKPRGQNRHPTPGRSRHRDPISDTVTKVCTAQIVSLGLLPKEAYAGGVGNPPCLAGEENWNWSGAKVAFLCNFCDTEFQKASRQLSIGRVAPGA